MSGGLSKKGSQIGKIIIFILIFISGASAQEYVHLDYDWEGDDVDVQDHPDTEFEACPACHAGEHMSRPKICEDCHLPNGAGPHLEEGDFALRADYSAPIVYEHYYIAEDITVKNLSFGTSLSTCFSVDPVVGGMCHGVSFIHRERAGGYFAFNENWENETRGRDPYEYAAPESSLPDTADCLFCHAQEDEQIMSMWGDALQINSTHSELENTKCYNCHVEGKTAPASFHARALYSVKEGEDTEEATTQGNRLVTAGVILILALASYLLLVRRPGKK